MEKNIKDIKQNIKDAKKRLRIAEEQLEKMKDSQGMKENKGLFVPKEIGLFLYNASNFPIIYSIGILNERGQEFFYNYERKGFGIGLNDDNENTGNNIKLVKVHRDKLEEGKVYFHTSSNESSQEQYFKEDLNDLKYYGIYEGGWLFFWEDHEFPTKIYADNLLYFYELVPVEEEE